jgi:perosamine synthetase
MVVTRIKSGSKMKQEFIPVCEPSLKGNEIKYALEALETGWISSAGKYVNEFEQSFADYLGVKHGIAVTNGTAAIHLALVALGVGPGDEVIIPNFTMIASAFAVTYTGAIPVFVDAEAETWNIDPEKIEEKISPATKAIMPVHIYGHPCEMDAIKQIALKHNLLIVEDAAESHGALYNGKYCGSLSDIGAFSFFANKIATTGEGGMVVTDDDDLAARCRYYKNLCFPVNSPRNYNHDHIGYNYRMSNVLAAIGLAQVERLDTYVEQRINNNTIYQQFLADVPGIKLQPELAGTRNVYWMNGVVVNESEFGFGRTALMSSLKQMNIDTRLFFSGMNQQPSLINYGCSTQGDYPVSDWLTANGFYLPSGSDLSVDSIKYICDVIKDIHARA